MLGLMDQVRLNYTISEELEGQLTQYCEVTGRTASDVVRQLIYEFLEDDRTLPEPAVVQARMRSGPRKDRRTDMWVSPNTFKAFHARLEQDGYSGKSAAIAYLLGDFLSNRVNHTAEEMVRVTFLINRDLYNAVQTAASAKSMQLEQLLAELVQTSLEKGKANQS